MNDLLELDLNATNGHTTQPARVSNKVGIGGRSAFDYLAATSGSSSAASSPVLLAPTNSSHGSNGSSLLATSPGARQAIPTKQSSSNGDAFASLFDGSANASNGMAGQKNLPMAQRMAMTSSASRPGYVVRTFVALHVG